MNVFIFPGQGAQFPGMGLEAYKSSDKIKSLFNEADEILGFKLSKVMFEGTEDELKQTKVTQPAIFLHSIAELYLKNNESTPDFVAGHSLGEFSALVANQTMSFADGLKIVSIRAKAMQKACENNKGGMAAILGLDDETIEKTCKNFNNVSFQNPICPIYQNVNGSPEIELEKIKINLINQLTSPVKWTQSVKNMINDGANNFTEFGPGKVLCGLVKKVHREVNVQSAF